MLRIYFMQQWFNLSYRAMEDALYDSESMRRSAGIDLVPDEKKLLLRFGTIVDATIIAALPSTDRRARAGGPKHAASALAGRQSSNSAAATCLV
jgi:IS5 family transposase